MCHADVGDCLVYPPGEPQWFEADEGGGVFVNDFVHAEGIAVREALADFAIPTGHLFRSSGAGRVGARIQAMMLEIARREPYWEQALELHFRDLCLGLGRDLVESKAPQRSPRQRELLERFRRLRAAVLASLEEAWSVSSMAEKVHLSRTRFSVLYRQFFGLPPGEDLLRERLQRARWLLARGNHTVAEVAGQCGFQSVCHFSRLFHERVGCPPRGYRG
jgi:AraC-like DNA-binding protein